MKQPQQGDRITRELMIYVRVTADEKKLLQEQADIAGLTISDYIRSRTINSKPLTKKATPVRKTLLSLSAELGKIGSNVNQIARALNRRADSEELIGVSKEHIENTLHAIEMLSNHLYNELVSGHTRSD